MLDFSCLFSVPKTFHQLAVGVLSGMLLDEYIENAQALPVHAECAECSATLLSYSKEYVYFFFKSYCLFFLLLSFSSSFCYPFFLLTVFLPFL